MKRPAASPKLERDEVKEKDRKERNNQGVKFLNTLKGLASQEAEGLLQTCLHICKREKWVITVTQY